MMWTQLGLGTLLLETFIPESVKIWSESFKMNFTEEDYWSGDIAITDLGWVFVFVKYFFCEIDILSSKFVHIVFNIKSNLHFQTQRKHVPNGWGSSADRCPVRLLAWGRASGK